MFRSAVMVLPAACCLLSACGYDHDNGRPGYLPGPYGSTQSARALLEVLHASPDAPPINVLLDGSVIYKNLDYAQGTGQIPVDATQSHSLAIQALTPGAPSTVIGPLTESFTANTVYTIVAEGPVASLGPVLFSHPQTPIAASATRVQVLHAAPSAPSVSVYVTVPGASLASSAPLGTFAFQGSIGPTDVPSGQYEIRVTPGNATAPVLFDSGTVTLPPGADLLLAAVQNTGPGTAPIALASVDQNGNNKLLLNVSTPADVRVVHDIADAPAVSVIANGNTAAPLVPSLAFPNFTAYLAEAPGNYGISVTPASNAGDILISQPLNLAAGTLQTFYAVGTLASPSVLLTQDDDRRIATEAKLRIIHGSPSAGPVDIYLTAVGVNIASVSPTYAAVRFGSDTGLQGFAAGAYVLTVTAAGSKTPAIGPLTITLKDSGIYTAVARDAVGGGTPLGLILLDDFAT